MSSPEAVIWLPLNLNGEPRYFSYVYEKMDILEARRGLKNGLSLSVPSDVPPLVDGAETPDEAVATSNAAAQRFPFLADPEEAIDAHLERSGEEMARRGIARTARIENPRRKGSQINSLTGTVDADDLLLGGTRLGCPTRLLLPVWTNSDGVWHYEDGDETWATVPASPNRAQERSIHSACVPVADYGQRWLHQIRIDSPSVALRGSDGRNSVWRRGPLGGVLFLDMISPHKDSAIVGDKTVRITTEFGLQDLSPADATGPLSHPTDRFSAMATGDIEA